MEYQISVLLVEVTLFMTGTNHVPGYTIECQTTEQLLISELRNALLAETVMPHACISLHQFIFTSCCLYSLYQFYRQQ